MIKIRTVKRLIHATSDLNHGTRIMESQIQRTRDRLNAGIGVDQAQLRGYKDPNRKYDNDRPLQRAARLYDEARYDVDKTLDHVNVRASISGEAAKIAFYQNRMRKFHGFSEKDIDEVVDSVIDEIREAGKRWR